MHEIALVSNDAPNVQRKSFLGGKHLMQMRSQRVFAIVPPNVIAKDNKHPAAFG
jgi:hypothetical protein